MNLTNISQASPPVREPSSARAAPTAEGDAKARPVGDDRGSAAAAPETLGQPPTPPRFPWLSRLSQQLGEASKQPPAFAAAPALGDLVDRTV